MPVLGPRPPVVRALLIGTVLLLPLQEAIKRRAGEPYPAVYMPSFGSVPQKGGTAFTSEPVVDAELAGGERRELRARELLPGNPVLPTDTLTSALVRRDAVAEDPRTVAWLRELIAAATGDEPRRAEIRIVSTEYDLEDGSARRSDSQLVRTVEFPAP